jgi:hypothetical protein
VHRRDAGEHIGQQVHPVEPAQLRIVGPKRRLVPVQPQPGFPLRSAVELEPVLGVLGGIILERGSLHETNT